MLFVRQRPEFVQRLASVTCPGGEGVDGARRDVGEGLKLRDRQGREQTLPYCSSVSGGVFRHKKASKQAENTHRN